MKAASQTESNVINISEHKLQRWILRILLQLDAYKQFITQHGLNNPLLVDYLQLTHYSNKPFSQQAQQDVISELHQRLNELERLHYPENITIAEQAITQLAASIGLNTSEALILAFTLQLQQERLLDDVAEWLGALTSAKVYRVLAIILNISEADVRYALGPDSVLTKTGLVNLEVNGSQPLRNKLEPFSLTFSERLYSGETDPARLLQGMICRCEDPHLKLENYTHVPGINILRQWLHHAKQSALVGVNILIHGQPGTGKSQLCRLIAQELQSTLYEVTSENEMLHPISGIRRLRSCRAAQRFFSGEQAIILLDEAEDVFIESPRGLNILPYAIPKAWLHRLMEENVVPTFWVSNDISSMDPALIRRFDIVLEIDAPPRAQRAEILQHASGGIFAPATLSQLADVPWLTPAVIQRAGNVVEHACENLTDEKRIETLTLLINSTLKAQGHSPIKHRIAADTPALYDTAFISSDYRLNDIGTAISPGHSARFCLYGPAGTGKTAWAYWLAEQTGMSVIERKTSQLFGCYLGESERNIAALFEQARCDKAILLIDEIDSFLSARDECQHPWQVSCTNEMLSQIAQFDGILIATTNRFDVLDAAALRRFDLKVRFSYLCDYQAMALLNLYCHELKLNDPLPESIKELSKLAYLTPGDFAVVARQHKFRPVSSAEAFVNALKTECWMKKRDKPAIGFLH